MTRCSLLPAIVSGLLAIALSGCCAVDSGIKNSGRGISSVEKVRLGGLGQFISIHGDDAGNPLLFLHGGPGVPEMPVAHLTGITPRVASVEGFRPRAKRSKGSETVKAGKQTGHSPARIPESNSSPSILHFKID